MSNEIKRSKELWAYKKYILDNTPAFVYLNTATLVNGNYVIKNEYCNQTVFDEMGLSRQQIDEWGADFLKEILHETDYTFFMQSLELLCLQENVGKPIGRTFRCKMKDGEYSWVLGNSMLMPHKIGDPVWKFVSCVISLNKEMQTEMQLDELLRENKKLRNEIKITKITPTELIVMQHTKSGLTSKLTAVQMFVSKSTIDSHKDNIMKKLGFPNFVAVMSWAIEMGVV